MKAIFTILFLYCAWVSGCANFTRNDDIYRFIRFSVSYEFLAGRYDPMLKFVSRERICLEIQALHKKGVSRREMLGQLEIQEKRYGTLKDFDIRHQIDLYWK